MIYCFDTSAFINTWYKRFPPEVVPTLWDQKFDELIDDQRLIAPDEVKVELEQERDDLSKWIKKRTQIFHAIDEEVQNNVSRILSKFNNLIDARSQNIAQADPFVIALAMATKAIVVSDETRSGTEKKPNIPFVCRYFKVEHKYILELIKNEKWQFT